MSVWLSATLAVFGGFWTPGYPDLSIENDFIEVGVSKEFGGAITWLSVRGEDRNLINNSDKGRQVQQSIYAGQMVDRSAEGQRKNWSPWPWNPVQAGDAYGNPSKMMGATSDGASIYTKVQPMLWDMNNELAEAYYETQITLEGPAVHVSNTVTCFRSDDRWQEEIKEQEIPAMYTIAALPNLYTYQGHIPWTRATTELLPHVFPSQRMYPTEKWAAYVDAQQWGVGIYNPDIDYMIYMFSGESKGETGDAATGYIAPVKQLVLGKSSVFTYDYYLIVGTVDEIRTFTYVKEGKAPATAFSPVPPPAPPAKNNPARWAVFGLMVLAAGAVLWRLRHS